MVPDDDRKFHLFITESFVLSVSKKILKTSADVNKDKFIFGCSTS